MLLVICLIDSLTFNNYTNKLCICSIWYFIRNNEMCNDKKRYKNEYVEYVFCVKQVLTKDQ